MRLAERLKTLRREKGLTQEYLAEQLQVSRQAVSKWERGQAAPSMEKLLALSRLLEIPLEQLAETAASDPKGPEPAAFSGDAAGQPPLTPLYPFWLRQLPLLLAALIAAAALLLAAGLLWRAQQGRAAASSEAAGDAAYARMSEHLLGEWLFELSDGRSAFLRLILTEGEYFTEEYEGYLPGGGVYPVNYQGSYRLEVRDSSENLLCTYPLDADFAGGPLNFPGEVAFALFDYNWDGRPEFTLGQYGSSSTLLYALYTLNGDGGIIKICPELIADSRDIHAFSVLFPRGEGEEGKGFRAAFWDNAIGEMREQPYRWQAAQGLFLPER